MPQFPRSVLGMQNRARKATELMVKHRSGNLTYSRALQAFGASPKMETQVGVKSALKELYALWNINIFKWIIFLNSLNQCYSELS